MIRHRSERAMTLVWVLLGLAFLVGFIPFRNPSVWTIYAVGNIATIICLIHCSLWAGWRTALKMFALTFVVGYIAEFIGVRMRSESTFGGYYYTEPLNGPLVFGVPPITSAQLCRLVLRDLHLPVLLPVSDQQSAGLESIATKTAPRFYLPAILVYLAFGVGVMFHPLIFGETEIGLAMSGVAMFATTIPVLAAILSLYRDGRPSPG